MSDSHHFFGLTIFRPLEGSMKRFLDSYRKRKVYAICLLFAFTGAFLCDFFCTHALSHDTQQHKSHFISSSIVPTISVAFHPGQLHGQEPIDDHENKMDSCCEKQAGEIYDVLIKQETLRLDFHHIELYFVELPAFILSISKVEKLPLILNTSLSPPKGGRAVRILIQSFLC